MSAKGKIVYKACWGDRTEYALAMSYAEAEQLFTESNSFNQPKFIKLVGVVDHEGEC